MFSNLFGSASWQLYGQVQAPPQAQSSMHLLGEHLLAAVVFSIVGIIVFFVCLLLMEKLAPFSIIKEIGEEHNEALGMIVGAMVLGISIIVAAAILG
jgi:putative membrane protein